MTINGIPLHPLVVHAAVVLVPLAALFAIAYAVLPSRRWQTRTPAAVLAVGAAVTVWLASATGDSLKEKLHENTSLIETHEHWAGLLQASMWVLAALVLVAWWSLPHHNPLPDKDHRQGVTTLAKPLVVLLPSRGRGHPRARRAHRRRRRPGGLGLRRPATAPSRTLTSVVR